MASAPPPPPPGFQLDTPPSRRRGVIGSRAAKVGPVGNAPPPPPGFILDPSGSVADGDTFGLTDGRNARLYGADAFEAEQTGLRDGQPVPLGSQATSFLRERVTPGSRAVATGEQRYGRPVAKLSTGGADVARESIGAGLSIPTPQYLARDPARLNDYVQTQRDAIAAERGAYAGQYQLPARYRQMGADAPWQGKTSMGPDEYREYAALLRDPKTTPQQLEQWAASRGRRIANAENLLAFMRDNPSAAITSEWQQADVTGEPVLRDGPGFVTRQLGALNEGIPDFLGFPVDAVNAGLGFVGVPVSDKPILGSEWIREGMRGLGIGQVDDSYAPRSGFERYSQNFSRGVGQAVVPIGGQLATGGRLALRAPSLLTQGSAVRSAVRGALTEGARRPGLLVAGELGAGAGSGIGGQVADDVAPGNPYAQVAGQVIGGFGGGVGAGVAASRPRVSVARAAVADGFAGPLPPMAPLTPDELRGALRVDVLEASGAAGPLDLAPSMALPDETAAPSISAPARMVDRIDVADVPPPPAGFALDEPSLSRRARPAMQSASPEELARIARGIEPGDVTPIPSNMIEGPEELARIGEGMRPELRAPNERDALPPYRVNGRTRRNPLDLVSWLRTQGGIREQGGELRAMGVDNRPRDLDFARDEGMLGRLVNENGMTLDDAARAAWEAGYFPDLPDRPTVPEFLDALQATYMGGSGRVFRPDDYGAIDDYNRAQGERFRIEAARETGNPLYGDLGQPIGPDDLKALEPPAIAYEDLPKAGGRIANINLANVESAQDISRLLQATETRFGGFDAARRGKITQAETEALAGELGMTADDLLKRRRGQALNAEQALAARQLLAKSSDELLNLAKRAKGGSDADMDQFRAAMLRHAAIYEQVTAATAEAGRALQQFRMTAKAGAVGKRIHKEMLDSGGRGDLEKVAADLLVEAEKAGMTPGGVTQFVVKAQKPKFKDKLVELWYNSLLSGPQTHVVNVTSNLLTAGLQLPEYLTAAGLGAFRRRSADRVLLSEVGPRVAGLLQGAQDGLRLAARTLRTGDVLDPLTKVEAQTERAISGLKGEIIRTPTRALSAEDEFFKAVARRMELNGLAVRKARGEGLRGDELRKRIADLTAFPTDDMLEASFDYARYLTFQRPVGDGIAGSIMRATQKRPWLKLFIPFVRTPLNILKFAVERSPGAVAMKAVRADLAAGGARRDLALARMALGTGLAGLVMSLAAEGKVTGGGPLDDNARRLLEADGWQPYSIRVGDQWVSYGRLDPLATTLGVAADLVEKQSAMTEAQQQNVFALMTMSLVQNLGDKTWFSGLADLVGIIQEPSRNLGPATGRLAGSIVVPALAAQTARASDPVIRATDPAFGAQSILDGIKARVPGVSQTLPARTDVFGMPRKREQLGPDMLSPFPVSSVRNDPAARELLALAARVAPPTRTLKNTQTGKKERLSAREYSEYQALAGQLLRVGLSELMAAPDYRELTPDEKRYEIDLIKRESRKAARERLFGARFSSEVEPVVPPPPGYQALTLPGQPNALLPGARNNAANTRNALMPALNGMPADMQARVMSGTTPPPPPGFRLDPPPRGFVLDEPVAGYAPNQRQR